MSSLRTRSLYEYRVLRMPINAHLNSPTDTESINDLAADGWDIVGAVNGTYLGESILYLRRPKDPGLISLELD